MAEFFRELIVVVHHLFFDHLLPCAPILSTRSFPGTLTEPSDNGLLGMAALFAGAARAPLTCIVMIPEMASSYSRIPPLIIASVLSYATAQILLGGGSIYSIKLMRRGVYLDPLHPLLKGVPAGEAMKKTSSPSGPR